MANRKTKPERAQRELQPGSMTDRLARLEVGEYEARAVAISHKASGVKDLIRAKRSLVGLTTPIVARVLERFPERKFEIDSGVLVTNGNRIYSTVVITRTK